MLPIRLVSSWCVWPWMTVTLLERLEDRLHLVRVLRPEVPRPVVLVERRVAEDDDRRLLVHLGQVLLQPLALLGADLEAGLDAVVQAGDDLHALHGRSPRSVQKSFSHARVEHHEVHALVVERVGGRAEQLAPLLAHVEEPVVLADHHLHRRLDALRICAPSFSSTAWPSCARSPPKSTKSGCGIQRVHVVHRLRMARTNRSLSFWSYRCVSEMYAKVNFGCSGSPAPRPR